MKILPRKGILLIKKHKKAQIKADIIVEETDEDKRLITGEVLLDDEDYKKGSTVIFGKYSIFPLTLQGEDFFFLDKNDVVATTDFKE
ncbi:MAG: hypothetical protein Q8M92_05130 [Candidatus Subteraquimicrobiales bacterium]|nr:hypothetical protein [Candidatus Subteraquimicrobiales bacterium]